MFDPEKINVGDSSAIYWLHVLGNTIKHVSWEFEKEWRYVSFDDDYKKDGKIIPIPNKPTAIICGNMMSEDNYSVMKEVAQDLNCSIHKVKIGGITQKTFIV